jgi:hypothetical protein
MANVGHLGNRNDAVAPDASAGASMRQRDGEVAAGRWTGLPLAAVDDVDDLAQDGDRLGIEGTHDKDELDDAQAPLAAFILGNERLRLRKPVGNLGLGLTAALAQVAQQLPELLLLRRAQGVAHGRRPRSTTAASAHNPGSGLSHFGIFGTDPGFSSTPFRLARV